MVITANKNNKTPAYVNKTKICKSKAFVNISFLIFLFRRVSIDFN